MKMEMQQFPVVTICGSMRFRADMAIAAYDMSLHGWIVLMPFVTFQPGHEQSSEKKEMLDRMHFAKINMSEMICVVSDNSMYVGESTRREIEYARANRRIVVEWQTMPCLHPEHTHAKCKSGKGCVTR